MTLIRIMWKLVCLLAAALLTGCYNNAGDHAVGLIDSIAETDFFLFSEAGDSPTGIRAPYSVNYNFVVTADSLVLVRQQPEVVMGDRRYAEEMQMRTADPDTGAFSEDFLYSQYGSEFIDTVTLRKHDHVVVADIRLIPGDKADSVWVQVARDQASYGWAHEGVLLRGVVPDDAVSMFIYAFSNAHLLFTVVLICLVAAAYLMRRSRRHRVKMLHFNDVPSFYPTLLALMVASSATLYSSIQMFAPAVWLHFYYYPTLNPFMQPIPLAIFLLSVWAIIITAIAAVDVVTRLLPFDDAAFYIVSLIGICALDYVVFSVSASYYIGYALLAAYYVLAIRRYVRHSCYKYECGNCGGKLRGKGRCPHCGAVNE